MSQILGAGGGGGAPVVYPITVPRGGTGLITITDHAVMVGSGVANVTPIGPGLTAQVLKGNTGADPSWGAVDLTTDVTGLLPVGSGGTGVGTLLIHGLVVGNTTGAVTVLAVGATNQVLLGNTGADPSWGAVDLTTAITGTLPVANGGTGAVTLTDHGVVLGSGVAAVSITAVGVTNTVLHGNTGADPTFSAVDLAADVTGTLPVANGGTGLTTITDHGVMVGSGVGNVTPLAVGTDGQVLLGDSANDPVFATLASAGGTITFTPGAGTLNLEAGGGAVPNSFPADAGTATPAAGALTIAGGTNINTAGAAATVTVHLDASIAAMTAVDFATGGRLGTATGVGNTTLMQAYDTLGAAYTTFATLTAGNPPTMDLDTAVTINSAYIYRVGGTDVSVADGGSGASTFTDHGVLLGSGAAAFTATAVGATNQVLLGNTGADPTWGAVDVTTDITGTLPVANGGTGAVTLTDHGVVLGSGVAAVSITAVGATNTVLHGNTGADPTFSAVDMAADVTGILPVANGGTGLSTITDHGIMVGSGAGAVTPLAVGTDGQVLVGDTANDPVFATLSSSGGTIAYTLGAGTLNLEAVGGILWTEVTGASQSMATNHAYTANNAAQVDFLLPATAAIGDICRIAGNSALGFQISQAAGQKIVWDAATETTVGAGGTLTSTDRYDAIEIVCITADTVFSVISAKGNFILA